MRKNAKERDETMEEGGVRVTEPGVETTWTEIATVAIKRGVSGRGDGGPPLVLTQHVGGGTLANGRGFQIWLALGNGALCVYMEATKDDPARLYTVSPRDMMDAILAKDFT